MIFNVVHVVQLTILSNGVSIIHSECSAQNTMRANATYTTQSCGFTGDRYFQSLLLPLFSTLVATPLLVFLIIITLLYYRSLIVLYARISWFVLMSEVTTLRNYRDIVVVVYLTTKLPSLIFKRRSWNRFSRYAHTTHIHTSYACRHIWKSVTRKSRDRRVCPERTIYFPRTGDVISFEG